MDKSEAKLRAKQIRFCEEYLIDLNGTQAAIRAGYSARTANEQSSQLLAKLNIQNYLRVRRAELQKQTNITQERVLGELAKIAFIDPRKFYEGINLVPVADLEDDQAAALASFEVLEDKTAAGEETLTETTIKKVKFWDKLRALEMLGKHLGIFERDNQQKTLPTTFNVNVVPPQR